MLESRSFILEEFPSELQQTSDSWQQCQKVPVHRCVSFWGLRYSRQSSDKRITSSVGLILVCSRTT